MLEIKSLKVTISVSKILAAGFVFLYLSGFAYAEEDKSLTGSSLVSVFDSFIYKDLFGSEPMRLVFSDETLIKHWLNIEVLLAQSQAELGVIPKSAAIAIKKSAQWENIDLVKLRYGTHKTGRPIKPLIDQIREAGGPEVGNYLHWGSTTQDIMDTATSLQINQGLQLLDKQLSLVIVQLAAMAKEHRATVMVARTNGQQAAPTTFGLFISTYMLELHRHRQRIAELIPRVAVGQSTGAVGTLAAMGDNGLLVREKLMEKLGLGTALLPWNSSRDNYAESIMVLGLIQGTLGRLANDIMTLSRLEIGEVKEGEGGASSTMPQKKNPRASEFISALTRMARIRMSGAMEIMDHSDTRTGSPWIVEWSLIPEMFLITSASLARAEQLLKKLEIYPEKMRKNIDISGGYAMSEAVMMFLAKKNGARGNAYESLKTAIKQAKPNETLREVIESNQALKKTIGDELDELLKPENYIGFAPQMVDQAVNASCKNIPC